MFSIVLLGVLNGLLTTGCPIRFDDLPSTLRCSVYCRVYLMVPYYRVSSIVLYGSVLQGVPYDLANSIVLCDLHFLRVDLANLRCS